MLLMKISWISLSV